MRQHHPTCNPLNTGTCFSTGRSAGSVGLQDLTPFSPFQRPGFVVGQHVEDGVVNRFLHRGLTLATPYPSTPAPTPAAWAGKSSSGHSSPAQTPAHWHPAVAVPPDHPAARTPPSPAPAHRRSPPVVQCRRA